VIRAAAACLPLLGFPACAGDAWEELEPGLALGRFPACSESAHGDSVITVVRADPSRFELRVLEAAATPSKASRTVVVWAEEHGLVLATNAGMYHRDGWRHVGFMATRERVNNPVPVESYRSVLAFEPKREGVSSFLLADLEETNLDALRGDYHTLIQNLRMISHRGKNVWSPSEKRWSIAALGTDRSGNLLFLFCRSPYPVHEFNDCLLRLPIEIARAQYLEGGPEASLHLEAGGRTVTLVGSFETGFHPDDGNHLPWPVPNVLGLVRVPDP
jgi:uncharacterized protein YigE (DUF2233 family)